MSSQYSSTRTKAPSKTGTYDSPAARAAVAAHYPERTETATVTHFNPYDYNTANGVYTKVKAPRDVDLSSRKDSTVRPTSLARYRTHDGCDGHSSVSERKLRDVRPPTLSTRSYHTTHDDSRASSGGRVRSDISEPAGFYRMAADPRSGSGGYMRHVKPPA